MTKREEIEDTVALAYVVQEHCLDSRNYYYWKTVSRWNDHAKAVESILKRKEFHRVVLQSLDIYDTGRMMWHDSKVVWESGEWVSPEHDPRANDPQYREYIRLKEIYG